MKRYILPLLILGMMLMVLPMIPAQEETSRFMARAGVPLDVKEQCFNNGTYCAPTALCNVTIFYPNQTTLIDNQPMTNTTSVHNFTLDGIQVESLGLYQVAAICKDGAVNGADTFFFRITPTGTVLSTAQGIIYLLVLLLATGLFCLSLLGAILIPFQNIRNEDHKVVQFNDLRYIKIFLWWMAYAFLTSIAFLMWNLTLGFLSFNVASNFFEWVWKALAVSFWPIFVVFVLTILINFLMSRRLNEALRRGLPTR